MFAEYLSGSTNTPNYVGEANVRPVKNGMKVKGIEIQT